MHDFALVGRCGGFGSNGLDGVALAAFAREPKKPSPSSNADSATPANPAPISQRNWRRGRARWSEGFMGVRRLRKGSKPCFWKTQPDTCPGGTPENSPAFQRREQAGNAPSPEGTAEKRLHRKR